MYLAVIFGTPQVQSRYNGSVAFCIMSVDAMDYQLFSDSV
jgi:hypothetical protein